MAEPERQLITMGQAVIEVTRGGTGARVICASHPAGAFGADVVALLEQTAQASVVCVNPRGIGASSAPLPPYPLEHMVDDIEQVRLQLGLGPWAFWGMSGGGWLGQLYAHMYPHALSHLILESVCSCFRLRLADAECLLSPFHPRWRAALEAQGLLALDAHATVGDAEATEWANVDGVGWVFRRRSGPALLVSPVPLSAELRRAMPALWAADARAWLGEIHTPTLVICGTADPVVPARHAVALRDAIPGAELLLVEGGGHAPVTERRPEVAERVRRFLHV